MNQRHFLAAMAMLGILVCAADAAQRTNEVGVVNYLSRYNIADDPGRERIIKSAAKVMWKCLEEIGLSPVWVDPDIFLERNRTERDQFKRILVPHGGEWFSRVIHGGMNDYVKKGGLLVLNLSLICEDNGDYVIGKDDTITKYPSETFLGVYGHSSAHMTRVKAMGESPLTHGLAIGEWIPLEETVGGRETRNVSAEVVVISDRKIKDRNPAEQPFLTFKHQGHGACIYLVGQVNALKDKTMRQIFRNIFSPETLEWLCLQE